MMIMKILSVNPLYLTIGKVDGFIEEKNGSNGIKNDIETIMVVKKVNMVKISRKLNLMQMMI